MFPKFLPVFSDLLIFSVITLDLALLSSIFARFLILLALSQSSVLFDLLANAQIALSLSFIRSISSAVIHGSSLLFLFLSYNCHHKLIISDFIITVMH